MKQIVILAPDLLGVGGIQAASRLTAHATHAIASHRGWAIKLLSLNDSWGTHSLAAPGHAEIPFQAFARAKARFLIAALLAARRSRIVITMHPNLAVAAAGMKRIAPKLKIVTVSHGVEVWTPLSNQRRRALLRSDLVLAPSCFTRARLIEVQSVRGENIRVLPWPLDPEFLAIATSPQRLSLPNSFPQGRVILTVGRWMTSERYKGLDQLIQAVADLGKSVPDLHLVAVGTGDDLPRLTAKAAASALGDRVHFFENLSREQVAACYAHSDLFALPSTGEGFGIVFLEAMAFKKPIVAVAFGGTMDLVQHSVNGLLVAPDDAQGLAQALATVLHDRSLGAQLGMRGAEIARTKYGFESFQDGLEAILQGLGID